MLPTFQALQHYYLGSVQYGGHYRDHQVFDKIEMPHNISILDLNLNATVQNLTNANVSEGHAQSHEMGTMIRNRRREDTSGLRLSYTFNEIGGPHLIGADKDQLREIELDPITGRDGRRYIKNSIKFASYLESKYGPARMIYLKDRNFDAVRRAIYGNQGIIRIAIYRYKAADARMALWDCDHFYQTRDWLQHKHTIAYEFWKTPDSQCEHSQEELEDSQTNVEGPSTQSQHHHNGRHHRNKHHGTTLT